MKCEDWNAYRNSDNFSHFARRIVRFHDETQAAANANWAAVKDQILFRNDAKKDYYFSKLFIDPSGGGGGGGSRGNVNRTADHTNFYFYIYQLLKNILRSAVLRFESDFPHVKGNQTVMSRPSKEASIISSLSLLVEYHSLLKLVITLK